MRNAYTFCIPSTIEGLSIVLLEAMSYNLPVIASDIDANREQLDNDAVWVRYENEEDITKVGRKNLDFGPGFYLTRIESQAINWATIIAGRKGRNTKKV